MQSYDDAKPAPPSWRVAKEKLVAPPGATAPKLLTASYLSSLHTGPNRAVSVTFEISEKGVPFNIRVEHASDAESEDEVITLIREWRFEAALKNGIPVQATGYLDLLIGDVVQQQAGVRPVPKKKR